ncbi:Pectate lyase superfamily protein [Neisseria weaveri]|uniref:Pectate lyase superfamily protein n=2 Tax=Neisseria weaveri TaxID=28091 RepID=A0A3S5B1S8_9NEIS|nr:mucin-2 [Neisseria weaveri LMG 5135]EGV38500.1 mucin-2 [Neisseria weaveri ATCC 51223]VEJ49268.1 Pectate lyase superfamily protein [Neisseria weaveri]
MLKKEVRSNNDSLRSDRVIKNIDALSHLDMNKKTDLNTLLSAADKKKKHLTDKGLLDFEMKDISLDYQQLELDMEDVLPSQNYASAAPKATGSLVSSQSDFQKESVSSKGLLSDKQAVLEKVSAVEKGNAVLSNSGKEPASGKHVDVKAATEVAANHKPSAGFSGFRMAAKYHRVVSVPGEEHDKAKIYYHREYGDYVDVRDFGADAFGIQDSSEAIAKAMEVAHLLKAAVYFHGTFKTTKQIAINHETSGVRAIFGDGMDKAKINYHFSQEGENRVSSHSVDYRKEAGILIDGQNNKAVSGLSLKYIHSKPEDFYRKGKSSFGKVNGILVTDADNTVIDGVEVSGANGSGILFTSVKMGQPEVRGQASYVERLSTKEIDESYPGLSFGDNNKVINSYLHHNRIAGVGLAFQRKFLAEGNKLAWNGHEDDGGTGYGIAAMAGSYNQGLVFRKNTTDHNYRKGLDVHDGNDILIENNVSIGDRLYGIAVYNRMFEMNNVKILNNKVEQDASFRLSKDDDWGLNKYDGYTGIQIQTNTQFRNFDTKDGSFIIKGNKISGLGVYKNSIHTYGIEFRNHEHQMDYQLDIVDNEISGKGTKYLIAVINDTFNRHSKTAGIGSGEINIIGNKANIERIHSGAVPVYVEEKNHNGKLHGSVNFKRNHINISEDSQGYSEGLHLNGNARHYDISNNKFEIHGKLNHPILNVNGDVTKGELAHLVVQDNSLITDRSKMYRGWTTFKNLDASVNGNSHNESKLMSFVKTLTSGEFNKGIRVEVDPPKVSIGSRFFKKVTSSLGLSSKEKPVDVDKADAVDTSNEAYQYGGVSAGKMHDAAMDQHSGNLM